MVGIIIVKRSLCSFWVIPSLGSFILRILEYYQMHMHEELSQVHGIESTIKVLVARILRSRFAWYLT